MRFRIAAPEIALTTRKEISSLRVGIALPWSSNRWNANREERRGSSTVELLSSLTVISRTRDNNFAGGANIFRHSRDAINYITDTTITRNYRNM